MGAVLLDARGKPQSAGELLGQDGRPVRERRMADAGWVLPGADEKLDVSELLSELPQHIRANLERGRRQYAERDRGRMLGFYAPPHAASLQTWEETLYAPIADGVAVTAAAETIMLPNFTLPANYLAVGRVLRYTLFFRYSTVITTPGTITQRLRYGGVAGVVLAASGAYAPDPTAASTTITGWTEYWSVCRSAGATGTVMCMGRMRLGDFDDASVATLQANLNMEVIPVSAAAVATVDTTAASALSPTWTQTVATGTMTVHLAVLESMS